MGLRHYFKELKMNMIRIQKSKEARSGTTSAAAGEGNPAKKKPAKKKKTAASPDKKGDDAKSIMGKST